MTIHVCGLHDEIARLRHRLHEAGLTTEPGNRCRYCGDLAEDCDCERGKS